MIALLSKIIKLNRLHIIGIIKNDNGDSFNVMTVKKKGNKINTISTESFESIEILHKKINRKFPVILVVDGKGVLNKEIDVNNEVDVNWQKNIDFSSIYYTSLKSKTSNFISFCRNSIINDTIHQFRQLEFRVVDIYIGSFLSALLYSSIKKDSIVSNDLILNFKDSILDNFSKRTNNSVNEEYFIDKQSMSNIFLPLYGVMIHFFIRQKEISKTQNETLDVDEVIYKKLFHILGTSILVSFLVSLLLSYLLIQHYGSKNAELNLQNVYSNQSYQLVLDLEKQKENKLIILKESGLLSSKFLSFYAYEIIISIPYEITLTQLNIIPAPKEAKENKKLNFEGRTIVIEGETFKESSFQNWMIGLKKIKWIQEFEIISLKKDKKNKTHFEIKITIKDV